MARAFANALLNFDLHPCELTIPHIDYCWNNCTIPCPKINRTYNCYYLGFDAQLNLYRVVASAVVVPEATEPPPQGALKRRQSSISETDSKRPRLSTDATNNHNGKIDSPTTDTASNQQAARRRSGQIDERKRGQRLFGALLGTLAQSSSSASQRRRADIEKKQQEKLKVQDAQVDQKRKARLANLKELRQREQERFDKQSVRILMKTISIMLTIVRGERGTRIC